jgi:alpha-beta hydrolase superfamily lysophospholipase
LFFGLVILPAALACVLHAGFGLVYWTIKRNSMSRRLLRILLKIVLFLGNAALIVFVTLILAGAFAARQGPELEDWHTVQLSSEFRAGNGVETLDEYMLNEQRVFAELERVVISQVERGEHNELNRYARGSLSYPEKNGRNWNRSEQRVPGKIRGGVLLLHGMTDSPYSLRHFARLFHEQGLYVLNLRMPGHGTTPGELARISWQDWDAAVKLGAAAVNARLAPGQPFYILGYSNGGSLALKYTLDSLDDTALRIPDRLFLISPMLGVSGLARFGKIYYWLGKLKFFEKASWSETFPEYDPFKYNSFPMNGARQSQALTTAIERQLRWMENSGTLNIMPPVLTFQSLVDSTVITEAIVTRLYNRLPANGSEFVLFDVNRTGLLEFFVSPRHDRLLNQLMNSTALDYTLTVLGNGDGQSRSVIARTKPPHRAAFASQDLGMKWPENFYSLSHVALPFPPDDEVYGFEPASGQEPYPQIGLAQMVGENGALVLPSSLFTRARSNPFFDYIEHRVVEAID